MSNGPVPTTLTLLSDLGSYPPGSKVRFLGCVTKYSMKTATLTLEHNHPPGNLLQAQVDVNVIAETLKSTESQIGEWVNVMGYVTSGTERQSTNQKLREVGVQAVMLWCAGPFNLQGYEQSLDKNKEAIV